MGELLRAERIKLLRHRATWFLVWIFPIGVSAVVTGMTIYEMLKGQAPQQGPAETAAGWIGESTFPWQIASNPIGRYLLAAFTAVAFGGEYGWNTWKLVAPHRSRAALLTAKYAMVLALIAVSLVLTAVLATSGLWANGVLTNDPAPAGVQFSALLVAHGRAALASALVVLLTVAYASAGATLTRSTIAGLVIAIVAITAESLILQLGPRFMHPTLYQALPGHHVVNLDSWVTQGEAVARKFPKGVMVSLHWGWSLLSYAIWTGGLLALTVTAFRKQDLN
jgi:ABC-type transport system involved in multi-copper enzyme maturation permease subunit